MPGSPGIFGMPGSPGILKPLDLLELPISKEEEDGEDEVLIRLPINGVLIKAFFLEVSTC